MNSAVAAMSVASRDFAKAHGLEPMARLVATGVGAVAPSMFGLGPVSAVHQAFDRAGWTVADIERAEINETFAAIAVALTQKPSLSEDIFNVEGGTIAHGHPKRARVRGGRHWWTGCPCGPRERPRRPASARNPAATVRSTTRRAATCSSDEL